MRPLHASGECLHPGRAFSSSHKVQLTCLSIRTSFRSPSFRIMYEIAQTSTRMPRAPMTPGRPVRACRKCDSRLGLSQSGERTTLFLRLDASLSQSTTRHLKNPTSLRPCSRPRLLRSGKHSASREAHAREPRFSTIRTKTMARVGGTIGQIWTPRQDTVVPAKRM